MNHRLLLLAFIWVAASSGALAGPYSQGLADPSNAHDAPVPGFVGPDGEGMARVEDEFGEISNPNNYVNPLFFGWAAAVADYSAAGGVGAGWSDPDFTLGPVTGDNFDIASLGELSSIQISGGTLPGEITLTFASPIKNLAGGDFVVFENSLGSAASVFGEVAYVEVSSNGVDFARFPSVSLTPGLVGTYSQINPTNVFNLAGKHVNAYGTSWGTPFDLNNLAADPLVTAGTVNLNAITHVRIVDIPGTGNFQDSATSLIDPSTGTAYLADHPIYDAWETFGSGGFDLEAVGVISRAMAFATWQTQRGLATGQQGELADPDGDGVPNLLEYAFARLPLVADNADPTSTLAIDNGRLEISFTRDERAVDLLYEVQASDDLAQWTTIASSVAGAITAGANGHAPSISEYSASAIASVGVLRRVSVRDVTDLSAKPRRFLRLRVTKI